MVQIIRRSPAHPLDELRAEMDRMFGRPAPGAHAPAPAGPRVDLDLTETEQAFIVQAEVPGIEPDQLEVSAVGDRLVLAGEKVESQPEGSGGRSYGERRFGPFRRELILPAEIDPAGVTAKHAHGVLTVTLPKAGLERPLRIKIEAS